MPRTDLIERKLKAIKDKDVEDIVAKKTYLPGIGRPKQTREVTEWLARRTKILEEAKRLPSPSIEGRITALSKTVCSDCKEALARNLEMIIPCEKDYETMCAIHLYRFALGFYE